MGRRRFRWPHAGWPRVRVPRSRWLVAALAALVLAAGVWAYIGVGNRFQSPGDVPREGPQLPPPSTPQDMDAAHRAVVRAFPAKTEGRGGTRLPFRLEGRVKVFELEASVIQWEVEPGVRRMAWAYNGIVPGPEIRVKEGDRVRVIVKNNLPESTSIHWHGIQIEFSQDGVPYLTQPEAIKPGESFTYEFTATPFGTHMYHSHHNAAKQVALGLLGPLIVEAKDPADEPWEYVKEETIVINDGPLGFTLQGKGFPATFPIEARLGEKVRIRWMNEGALGHPMHIHGLLMKVVARDGRPLESPFWVDTIMVNPGERWDTIVEADNPGSWLIHCHILPHAEGEHGMHGMATVFIVKKD